jgi:hypothetical protein
MLKPDIGISPFDAKTGGLLPTDSITMLFFCAGPAVKKRSDPGPAGNG